jgi:hypothetical protein
MDNQKDEAENPDFELDKQIEEGLLRSNVKLIEAAAARDGELIISDGKGKPISVPAKELLKRRSQQR